MADLMPFAITDECYDSAQLRLAQSGTICGEGVKTFDGLRVTQTTVASTDILVSAGGAWIQAAPGDVTDDDGGMYYVHKTEDEEIEVPLNSSGSPRTDRVWYQVCDFGYGAPSSGGDIVYEDDNPTGTPPADDCTYYLLATIVVPNGGGAGGTTITGTPTAYGDTDSMITDERSGFQSCASATPYVALSGDGSNDIPKSAYFNYFDDNYTIDHVDEAFFTVTDEAGHPKITALEDGLYAVSASGGFLLIGTAGSARTFVILINNTNLPDASPNGTRVAENRVGPLTTFYATPSRDALWCPAGTTFKFACFQDSAADPAENVLAGHLTVRKIG